jgi:hypothetical protein
MNSNKSTCALRFPLLPVHCSRTRRISAYFKEKYAANNHKTLCHDLNNFWSNHKT